ncbi:hypothetical protein F511_36347 [Dorcoceras hygrometricum]|uniref:Uncharacterized protein n=1 Tax=Dorcoceras hygrometricum TaxID=472368 RepID=A0A2Z7DBK8_9LAMI|nr:hypothetical protein F511_36347 [Dorcoceras hygrometricum]
MHTSRNCVTNYIHKFNVIVLGRELFVKGFDSLAKQFSSTHKISLLIDLPVRRCFSLVLLFTTADSFSFLLNALLVVMSLLITVASCWMVMTSLLMSSTLSAPAELSRSSSSLRLFLASVPAGPFAPADLSSSAEHDVVTDYIIIDGPLRCSSWFSFDVPADPSSSSSACSWFLSFQLVHYAPAGSTWPLPDFEHLT